MAFTPPDELNESKLGQGSGGVHEASGESAFTASIETIGDNLLVLQSQRAMASLVLAPFDIHGSPVIEYAASVSLPTAFDPRTTAKIFSDMANQYVLASAKDQPWLTEQLRIMCAEPGFGSNGPGNEGPT